MAIVFLSICPQIELDLINFRNFGRCFLIFRLHDFGFQFFWCIFLAQASSAELFSSELPLENKFFSSFFILPVLSKSYQFRVILKFEET